jgi:hypothetical protein
MHCELEVQRVQRAHQSAAHHRRMSATDVRMTAIRDAQREIDKLGVSLAGKTATQILQLLDHEDAHFVWTGLWTSGIRSEVGRRCPCHYSSMRVCLGSCSCFFRFVDRAFVGLPIRYSWSTPFARCRSTLRTCLYSFALSCQDKEQFDKRKYDR